MIYVNINTYTYRSGAKESLTSILGAISVANFAIATVDVPAVSTDSWTTKLLSGVSSEITLSLREVLEGAIMAVYR